MRPDKNLTQQLSTLKCTTHETVQVCAEAVFTDGRSETRRGLDSKTKRAKFRRDVTPTRRCETSHADQR